jgi:putative transposase
VALRITTYRLYPTPRQEQRLAEFIRLHCEIYNAAIQERRDAYSLRGLSLSFFDQQKQIKDLWSIRPELTALGSHAIQGTLRRVDFAYKRFFRRCRDGAKRKGYPRFKSSKRFRSFTYPDNNNWKVLAGRIEIRNLGAVKMRGKARTSGTPRTCTILRKAGGWYASIVIKCEPERKCLGDQNIGIDLGLESLATLSTGEMIENPRHLKKAAVKLACEQRALSRKKRGSRRCEKQQQKVARLYDSVANVRKDYLHKCTAMLVGRFTGISIERMQVARMSSKGGARKRGLNRSIADAAWGMIYRMLEYKCSEASVKYLEINPREHAPTQSCSSCRARSPKDLRERVHACSDCGLTIGRDLNAALNILRIGFGSGTGLSVEGSAIALKHSQLIETRNLTDLAVR